MLCRDTGCPDKTRRPETWQNGLSAMQHSPSPSLVGREPCGRRGEYGRPASYLETTAAVETSTRTCVRPRASSGSLQSWRRDPGSCEIPGKKLDNRTRDRER